MLLSVLIKPLALLYLFFQFLLFYFFYLFFFFYCLPASFECVTMVILFFSSSVRLTFILFLFHVYPLYYFFFFYIFLYSSIQFQICGVFLKKQKKDVIICSIFYDIYSNAEEISAVCRKGGSIFVFCFLCFTAEEFNAISDFKIVNSLALPLIYR